MRNKILMRVGKGKLVPADGLSEDQLRNKGYRIGDLVNAEITKARSPEYNRLAHAFGTLVADNIDDFTGMGQHQVLKRLQLEADVECDVIRARVPGFGIADFKQARSLSFGSMDQARFETLIKALARHVAVEYWRSEVDAEDVIEMANEIIGAAA